MLCTVQVIREGSLSKAADIYRYGTRNDVSVLCCVGADADAPTNPQFWRGLVGAVDVGAALQQHDVVAGEWGPRNYAESGV